MWYHGHVNGYYWQAQVFELGSKYGINGGRVSRLWIKNESDNKVVFNYDRGPDLGDTSSDIVKEILGLFV